jgi:hypothetical protein
VASAVVAVVNPTLLPSVAGSMKSAAHTTKRVTVLSAGQKPRRVHNQFLEEGDAAPCKRMCPEWTSVPHDFTCERGGVARVTIIARTERSRTQDISLQIMLRSVRATFGTS